MSEVSTHLAYKTGLLSAAAALLPDRAVTTVCWGHPGNSFTDEIVAMMRTTSAQEIATQGRMRGREELLTQEVHIIVYRQGEDWRAQQEAEERCLEILGMLEYHVRITDTTLGGAVRQCFLTDHEADGFVPADARHAGWMAKLEATFTAKARISGTH